MAEYRDEYVADLSRYVPEVKSGAAEADKFKDKQEAAALAARRMALAASEAGDKAARAQRKAAEAASVYEHAAKDAADAAQALARGEIDSAEAAKAGERALKANGRAAEAASRSMHALERADIAAAVAAKAAAKAIDDQADQLRQLDRAGSSAFTKMAKAGISAAGSLWQKWSDVSLLIKAAILVLPIAATAAGAGIALGLGAGFAGGAIAIAAQNEKVKAQFSGLGKYVMADLKSWATPYQGLLIRTASRAGDAFDEIGPHIKAAFAGLVPDVERFAQAALVAFGNLGPYVDRGVAAFHPLMTILSARLPGMIDNVANQLTRMTESVDPRAWDQLLGGVNAVVSGTGNLVVALERVDSAYLALEGHSRAGLAVQQQQAEAWHRIGEHLGIVEPKMSELVPLTNSSADGMRNFANAAAAAAAKTREWNNAVLASYNSQIALEQSIDDANKTIKDNGKTLDINTQKGRENKSALLAIGGAALKAADDAKKSGADTSAAMNRGYNAFMKAAHAAGMTRDAARALARQIGLVPSAKYTRFTTNSAAVRQAIRDLQSYINRLHGKTIANHVVTYYSNVGSTSFGPGNRKLGNAAGGYIGYADGGFVDQARAAARRFPTGGMVRGPGTATSDSIATNLSNGEYVINAAATRAFRPVLDAINYGHTRRAPVAAGVTRSAGATVVHNVYLTVHGTVISERNLVETVRKGLAQRSVYNPGNNGTIVPRGV